MASLDKINALVKSAVELQALANQVDSDKQSLLSTQAQKDQ
jgi:hypothetical protein